MDLNIRNRNRRFISIFAWFLVAVCMVIIFLLSNQVADESAALSEGFLSKIMELFNTVIGLNTIRKTAHAFEYFGLAVLIFHAAYWTWHKSRPCFTFLIALLYSISDEIHQIFVPGRACRITDICIDSLGAIAGILLCLTAVYLFNKLKRRRRLCKEKSTK